jgi:hypothetical protein
MRHISLSESYDLIPLRCPACSQLVCEPVERLKSDQLVRCRVCHAATGLDQLVAADPALGRVLSMHSDIRFMRQVV